MLQLQILTSSSKSVPNPIIDFGYIYELAKCTKCQTFIVLRSTNALYGFGEDACCIHEVPIPFAVNSDLVFRMDASNKDIVSMNDQFFIPDEFPWVLLPGCCWEMYVGGDIYQEYDPMDARFILKDKNTLQPIEQIHMYKTLPSNDFSFKAATSQLEMFFARCGTLEPPITFDSAQTNPGIRKAYDGKASLGRTLVSLQDERASVAFYIYKSLFTLNKADTLDIDIRFDRYQKNTFMATFRPHKKRSPINNKYGLPYSECIHCMFVNISM